MSGIASITGVGTPTVTVDTNAARSIVNWQTFSIGVGDLTRFNQLNSAAAVLNRVVGSGGPIDPSVILGQLTSNGRVFLINPSGITFGFGSQVDVAGLVASTLGLSDGAFLGGNLNFTAVAGAGSVVNQGSITTGDGGNVYLIGPAVTNNGIITSPRGEVVLAAGNTVQLVDPGTPNLQVQITAPDNQAVNMGQIIANAGRIGIHAGLVTQTGTVQANEAVVGENGRILLRATQNVTVGAGSTTTAETVNGGTGEIGITAGGNVTISDASVRASGALDIAAGTVTIASAASPTEVFSGAQTITASGAVTVQGGPADANTSARLVSAGDQTISASSITVAGGDGGNSFAEILQTSGAATQTINSAAISVTGGTGAQADFARIRSNGAQTIAGDPAITVTGGASGGVAGQSNNASISAGGTQTIEASTIGITAGAGGTDNSATITGGTQFITTTGDVHVSGSTGGGTQGGARIGSPGGQATNLTLTVGGDLVLTGGPNNGANLGSNRSGFVDTNMVIDVAGSLISTNSGNGANRIGTPGDALGGGNIVINAGTDGTGDILLSGRVQLRTLGDVTITTPGILALTGGDSGSGNSAVVQNSGDQHITASAVALTGGSGGTSNFARILSDNGNQTIAGSPVITLTGGAGGAPDQGNFAQIRASNGTQIINAADITLAGGTNGGFSNFASIQAPVQTITIDGNLALTGGNSELGTGLFQSGGARIGGVGGSAPSATNLMLTVTGDVNLTGGEATNAGAAIGSTFAGGQTTDITMNVGGSVTLNSGLVSGSRIGSPSSNVAGGDIVINAGTSGSDNILINGGTAIRTLGNIAITTLGELSLAGGSGAGQSALIQSSDGQVITAGNVSLTGGASGSFNSAEIAQTGLGATQSITITGGGTLALQGGAGGSDNFARIRNQGVNQQIEFASGGTLTLTGGSGVSSDFAQITANNGSQTIGGLPAVTLTGGTGGLADLGNRAQIRAPVGTQTIAASAMTLIAGESGVSNGVNIQALVQDVSITGDLAMTGGGSASGTTQGGGARIGGPGGGFLNPTNLTLGVGADVTLAGGTFTSAIIGSATLGGTAPATIAMTVGGNLILDTGLGGGARIGSNTSSLQPGDITITAGTSGPGNIVLNGRASIATADAISIVTPGNLTLTGGVDRSAQILSSGNQGISANNITLTGGTSNSANATAEIRQLGAGSIQTIDADGVVVLIGGTTNGTGNSFARIQTDGADATQIIDAGAIALGGGAAGVNSFTVIAAPHQTITTAGNVTLHGGPADNAGSRIGGVGNTTPTDLVLDVGGALTLNGGSFGGGAIGANRFGGQPTDITIMATGDVTLNPGSNPGANPRIGGNAANLQGGNVSITSTDGNIVLNSAGPGFGTAINTLDDVTLVANSITQGADSVIRAGALTTSTLNGTDLPGANQVGTFNGTSGFAGMVLNNSSPLLTVTGINTFGGPLALTQTGDLAIAGSVFTGPQTISATGAISVVPASPAIVSAAGTQTISAGGALTLAGAASGSDSFARIVVNGEQLISAASINVTGGGGQGNFAQIVQTSGAGTQTIDADSITVTGGTGAFGSFANIRSSGSQTITGAPAITLTGGASGGIVGQPNNVNISAVGTQTIAAGTIDLMAGAGGIDNSAAMFGGTQVISTTGDVHITGGGTGGTLGGARIGGPGGAIPAATNLSLTVGGNLILTGGPNTPAIVGASGPGLVDTHVTINVAGDLIASTPGNGSVRIGTPANALGGGNIEINAGDIFLSGRSQVRTLDSATITTGTLALTAGGSGSGNQALIQTGGDQTITAAAIALTGGSGGFNNFARIQSDNGNQTILGSPVITLTGGAGGVPDQGNFAQMRASNGTQTIIAGDMTLAGGTSGGFSNFASIQAPVQTITVNGNLELIGGNSELGSGLFQSGGVRIGGTGGSTPSPTNLTLDVTGDVSLTGGGAAIAGAAIGSTFSSSQATDITMNVGGNLTLNPGTVAGGGSRIGSPSGNPAGGNIVINAGTSGTGDIVISGGTAIRTLGDVSITTPDSFVLAGGTGTSFSAQILGAGNMTINAGSIALTGGIGDNNVAEIHQNGLAGSQTIVASSISLAGGSGGAGNYARLRADGAAVQTISGLPAITLLGGTHGAPDQGNFAQVRAANGTQSIDAGSITMTAGPSGFSNFAVIQGPQQFIDVAGDLTVTGGGSASGVTQGGGARVGGLGATQSGGVIIAPPQPTDLTLTVGGNVTLAGGSSTSAIVGSTGIGGSAPNSIAMVVGGNLTLATGLGAGARIGSSTSNLQPGNITITATGTSGPGNIVLNGRASIATADAISIGTPGNLTLTGGTDRSAQILSAGDQTLSANNITLAGGTSNSANATAEIRQLGAGSIQTIDADGVVVLIGGTTSASGNSFARIQADGTDATQIIDAGSIALNGGASGINSFTVIAAPHQTITTAGNVTLQGGAADNAGSRIGGVGNTTPTDLVLNVGGALTLTGGSFTGGSIGANRFGGQPTDITIMATGDVTLNPGSNPGANPRIGGNAANLQGGNVSITSTGGNIVLNSAGPGFGTAINTLDNVTLAANAIVQGAESSIVADALSTHTVNGASLGGANQLANYHATNSTAGDLTLFNSSSLLTVNGINQVETGALTINQSGDPGDLILKGTITSGPQTITATGSITVMPASPAIVQAFGPQTIKAGGVLTVAAGSGEMSSARVSATGGQSIAAAGLTIVGGSDDNAAEVAAPNQAVTVSGDVTIQGGSSSSAGARIGGLGGTNATPTNLSLDAGSVTVAGGASGAAIGSDNNGGQTTNIALNVQGGVTLTGGTTTDSTARIGSPSGSVAGGTVTVTAGGDIALGSGTAIQTTENVTLAATGAGSTITQDPGATIQATELTASSDAGVTLAGNNNVSSLNVAGDIVLSFPGDHVFSTPLTGTGNITLSADGNLTVADTSVVAAGSVTINAMNLDVAGMSSGALVQAGTSFNANLSGQLNVRSDSPSNAVGGSAAIVAQGTPVGAPIALDSLHKTSGVGLLNRAAGHGPVNITASSVLLEGGGSTLGYALVTGGAITVTSGGNIQLKGGSGAGSFAWMLASQSMDLTVGGNLLLNAGTGQGAFARVQTAHPTIPINVYFPYGGNFSVNDVEGAYRDGTTGFFTGPTAATPDKRLIITYGEE